MTLLDIAIVLLLIASVGDGLRVGFVRKALGMVGWLLAIAVAAAVTAHVRGSLADVVDLETPAIVAFVMVGLGTYAVARLVGALVSRALRRGRMLFWIDSVAGGAIAVGLAILVVCGGLQVVDLVGPAEARRAVAASPLASRLAALFDRPADGAVGAPRG